MPIDLQLAERFIDGEVLQGEEAKQIMTELGKHGGWRLYVTVALAALQEGRPEYAEYVLSQLMKEHEALDLG